MNKEQGSALIEHEPQAIELPAQTVTPMHLVQMAVQQGADIDKLGKLLDLQLRWEADQARKAYVAAMAEFKATPPSISKNKEVDFSSAKGRTHYKHATLDNVSGTIGAALAKVDISHRWDVAQLEGGAIRVTCVLTHKLGHSESVFLQASRDESGNKNNIQAVGSTVTYLQRYTLLAATGMAVNDSDDDAQGGQAHTMNEGQRKDFEAAIDELADKAAGEVLWKKIANATTQCGDVTAYADLRTAYAKKLKTLKAPTNEL